MNRFAAVSLAAFGAFATSASAQGTLDIVGTAFVDQRVQVNGRDMPGLAGDAVSIAGQVGSAVLVAFETDDECAVSYAVVELGVRPAAHSGQFQTGSPMVDWGVGAGFAWVDAPLCEFGVGPTDKIVRWRWDEFGVTRR